MTATKPPGGIFQRVRPHGVWYARRIVPADLRQPSGLGRELVRSLGTSDPVVAAHLARDILAEFDAAIEAARRPGSSKPWTLEAVTQTLERWLADEQINAVWASSQGYRLEMEIGNDRAPVTICPQAEPADLNGAVAEARRYYSERPAAAREVGLPPATAVLIDRLEAAVREPNRWVDVPGLDRALDEAFAAQAAHRHHLQATRPHEHSDPLGAVGEGTAIPVWARDRARRIFIPLYLQAVKTWEWERSRHAAILAASAAIATLPTHVQVKPVERAYTLLPGDKLFSELTEAFLSARAAKAHRYRGIIAALEEVVGPDRPVRAIMKGDVKAALVFVRRIPKNAKKFWPELTLAQAVEKADADGRGDRLSPGSVATYFAHLCSLFSYAIDEDWLETSPCADIKVEGEQTTGGFTGKLRSATSSLSDRDGSQRFS